MVCSHPTAHTVSTGGHSTPHPPPTAHGAPTQLAHEPHGRARLAALLRQPQRVLRVVQRLYGSAVRRAAGTCQVPQQGGLALLARLQRVQRHGQVVHHAAWVTNRNVT